MMQSTSFDDTPHSNSIRLRTGLAWLLLLIGCLLLLAAIGMAFARRDIPIPDVTDSEPWFSGVFNSLATLSLLITGGFLTLRLPRNNLAWLMLIAGFGYALHIFAIGYTYTSYLVAPEPLPLTALMFILAPIGLSLLLPTIPMIVLLFPSGRLPSPRWRFAYGIWLFFIIMFGGFSWLSSFGKWVPFDNPLARGGELDQIVGILSQIAWFSFLGLLVLATLSAILRSRRAEGQERQQFKWLTVAAIFIVVTLLLGSNIGTSAWVYLLNALSIAAIPVAIAVAVARYRLWDLDLVIRRTTQYALLTGILALVYFGSVIILQRLLSPLTGESTAAVVLSTLLIAALFLPLRRRVQQTIDHRFFRRKYDAEKVMERFAATVRDETDLDALTAELTRVIQETMEPEHVSIWLKPASANRPRIPDAEKSLLLEREPTGNGKRLAGEQFDL